MLLLGLLISSALVTADAYYLNRVGTGLFIRNVGSDRIICFGTVLPFLNWWFTWQFDTHLKPAYEFGMWFSDMVHASISGVFLREDWKREGVDRDSRPHSNFQKFINKLFVNKIIMINYKKESFYEYVLKEHILCKCGYSRKNTSQVVYKLVCPFL